MGDSEERAAAARRALSEFSKALKRAGPEEKLRQLGPVVKAYQEEINELTRRAKAAETAFLTLYTALLSTRDPSEALHAAAASVASAAGWEAQVRALRLQVAEYDSEFSRLKNQDASLRRLEADVREADRRAEQRVQAALAQERELHAQEAAEAQHAADEREEALHAALGECHEALRTAQAQQAAQQNAHFAASEKADRLLRDAEREVEAVRHDHEQLSAELLQLRQRLAVAPTAAAASAEGPSQGQSDDGALSSLEESLFSLREALAQREAERDDAVECARRDREELSAAQALLQAAVDSHAAQIDALQRRSDEERARSDRGRALTALDDAERRDRGDASDGSGDAPHATAAAAISASSQSSELATLQASVLRLQSELTEARERLRQREAEWTAADTDSRASAAQHEATIAQLEADVHTLQQQLHEAATPTNAQRPGGRATVVGADTVRQRPMERSSSASDPPADAGSVVDGAGAASGTTLSTPPLPCCSCASLLSIVSGQRDRLRARVEVAEKAASDANLSLLEAQQRMKQLNADNLELYEKLQFVKQVGTAPPTPHVSPPLSKHPRPCPLSCAAVWLCVHRRSVVLGAGTDTHSAAQW